MFQKKKNENLRMFVDFQVKYVFNCLNKETVIFNKI